MPSYNSTHTGLQIDNGIIAANAALSKSEASTTYLTQANAASTYLTQANASTTYLTQTNAASTYFPKSNVFIITDKTVAIADWASDATYTAYPYKAIVSDSRVTASTYCEVVFNLTDATSGYFAPICNSVAGGIEIWASSIPLTAITIPTIKCTIG